MFNLLASFAEFWDDFGGIIILSLIVALSLACIIVSTVVFVRGERRAKREAELNKERVYQHAKIDMSKVKTVEVKEEKAKKEKKSKKQKEEPIITEDIWAEEESQEIPEEVVEEAAPAQAVAEEIESVPVEEAKEEPEQAENVAEETVEEELAEESKEVEEGESGSASYHVPFEEKLASADQSVRDYFKVLDEKLTSYRKIHGRISQKCASYRLGRELKAKISLRGKTLKLHLALNVNDFNEKVYFQRDYKDIKAYEEVPFTVKVKSERGLKNAIKLIEELCKDLKPIVRRKPVEERKKFVGKWVVEIKSEDEYIAKLSASNGEVMLSSEIYTTEEGAKAGIVTIIKAIETGEFIIYQDKSKEYYYKLKNAQNRFLCAGEIYKTKDQCLKSVESVKRIAGEAIIQDELVEGDKYVDYVPVKNPKYEIKKGLEGKWRIETTEDGKFCAKLYASNGQLMLSTEAVASKKGAFASIDSVKKYSKAGLFVIDRDKFGRFYYKLRNNQKSVVCMGEAYDSLENCTNALESVRRFAATAIIVKD